MQSELPVWQDLIGVTVSHSHITITATETSHFSLEAGAQEQAGEADECRLRPPRLPGDHASAGCPLLHRGHRTTVFASGWPDTGRQILAL